MTPKGTHLSKEHRESIRRSLLGKTIPASVREKISRTLKSRPGRPHTEESKALMRRKARDRWRDIRSNESRKNYEVKLWRKAVLERDGYKCRTCGSTKYLHAHHIKTWDSHPELRLDIDNGKTLCRTCHYKEDLTGRTLSYEARAKLSHYWKGRPRGPMSQETKDRISQTKRMKKLTEKAGRP